MDGTDEEDCSTNTTSNPNCPAPWFYQCESASRNCILDFWRCDGDDDCGDGSDERNCSFTTTVAPVTACEYHCAEGRGCVSFAQLCDGVQDCRDGSDEEGCGGGFTTTTSAWTTAPSCSQFDYRCDDGSCIALRFTCDGVMDCPGGDDELGCDSRHQHSCDASREFQCLQSGSKFYRRRVFSSPVTSQCVVVVF